MKKQIVKQDAALKPFNKAEQASAHATSALKTVKAVKDEASKTVAESILRKAKEVVDAIETKRKELVKPFNESTKNINAYAKQLTTGVTDGIDEVKGKLVEYVNAQEQKAAKEAAKHLNKLDDLEAQRGTLLDKAQKAKGKRADDIARELDKVETRIGTTEAKAIVAGTTTTTVSNIQKRWTYEVFDAQGVPREYCIPDPKLITEAIKAGERTIPGVRIYQDTTVAIR